jgi:hypothetical protein
MAHITARPSVFIGSNVPPPTPVTERRLSRLNYGASRMMTAEQIALNPEVEYTRFTLLLQTPMRLLM